MSRKEVGGIDAKVTNKEFAQQRLFNFVIRWKVAEAEIKQLRALTENILSNELISSTRDMKKISTLSLIKSFTTFYLKLNDGLS